MKNLRNKSVGKLGEELAAKYLAQKNFKILEQNFHKRYSEIDIVAIDGNTLVFVEVKTRIGTKFGLPEESITPRKLRSLIYAAQYYKLVHQELPQAMRIDVVSVLLFSEDKLEKITHYQNVTG